MRPRSSATCSRDQADAAASKVEKTPKYFVNGRRMEAFGYEQLRKLGQEDSAVGYP